MLLNLEQIYLLTLYCGSECISCIKVTQFKTVALLKNASKNVVCMCVVQIEGKRKMEEKRVLFKESQNKRKTSDIIKFN